MKEIDYKQAVETLVEHLNFIPIRVKHARPAGDFIFRHKEYVNPVGIYGLTSIFYYQDFSTKKVLLTLRREYELPKEIGEMTDEIRNGYFNVVYDDILRWALLGKTTDKLKDGKGDTVLGYNFRDLIGGNYETE